MDFLINESQLRIILQEQDQSKMTDYMRELYSFTLDLIKDARKTYGLNIKFLSTWGASVGGLVLPLDNFIRTGNFSLTEEQITLLLTGVACTFFYDNISIVKKIDSKIKEKGLESTYQEVLVKAKNLKDSFIRFIKSANVVVSSTMEIITYTFLIPIITDILQLMSDGNDPKIIASQVAKRLVASGVVLVGQITLSKTIKKIIQKFES